MFSYLILFDYFGVLRRREAIVDFGTPLLLISLYLILFRVGILTLGVKEHIIDVIAILTGFSITALTVLTTSETPTIQRARSTLTKRKIRGVGISVYQIAHVTISYTILVEIAALILALFLSSLNESGLSPTVYLGLISFTFYLLLHILFAILRTVTSFYLLFWNKEP